VIELGRMKFIPSPLLPGCQVQNFLKKGGLARYVLGAGCVPSDHSPGRKKVEEKCRKFWTGNDLCPTLAA